MYAYSLGEIKKLHSSTEGAFSSTFLSVFLSLEYTYYAFGGTIALVCRSAAYHLPSIIAKKVKLVFELICLNTPSPKTFCIINNHFILELFHIFSSPTNSILSLKQILSQQCLQFKAQKSQPLVLIVRSWLVCFYNWRRIYTEHPLPYPLIWSAEFILKRDKNYGKKCWRVCRRQARQR